MPLINFWEWLLTAPGLQHSALSTQPSALVPRNSQEVTYVLPLPLRPPGRRLRAPALLASAAQALLERPVHPRRHCAGVHAGAAADRPRGLGAVAGDARDHGRAHRRRPL